VPYETEADAEAVRATLAVDNELQPDKVVKRLKVEGTDLVAEFFATEPRLLRAAVAAFLDLLNLSTRTIETFGHVPVA
jgi:tRNA threonylcarbamoyladenosine modification (KEOPS) complex  Pcc1 subunit